MPATIRIDFDVHSEAISESLRAELAKTQTIVSSANAAVEAAQKASITEIAAAKKAAAEKAKQDEIDNARSVSDLKKKAEEEIARMRAGFSAKVWGSEKEAAGAIVEEIKKLQENKDSLVRAAQMEGISKVELAQINSEKKTNDRQLATMRRLALENKEIAEHGAAASVGILGIGRNIENNFDKASGALKSMGPALGVVGGFSLAGLAASANKAKEETEAMATVLRSANVPAEQIGAAVDALKGHANEFADAMGLPRDRAREVATEVVGLTGLTGKAAEQATDLALAYEHASGGILTAEKFSKLLNKSIGDPENEKSLKILEAKYPGIGEKMAAAATEQDKLNILQQAAGPAMNQMAENASGAFDRIGVLLGSAKDGITQFIGANMDTIGVAGQVSAGFLPLVGTFQKFEIAQKASAAAQWLWNVAMNANPIGLIITAIAALVGGLILLYNNVKPVRDAIDGMVSWVVTAYKSFMEWYDSLGLVGKIALSIIMPITLLIKAVKEVVGWLSDLFSSEEKVVDENKKVEETTTKVSEADKAAAVASQQRTEAIDKTIKKLKEQQETEKNTIESAKALAITWDRIARDPSLLNPAGRSALKALLGHDPTESEIREYAKKQVAGWVASVKDELIAQKDDKVVENMFTLPEEKKKEAAKKIKFPEITLPKIELPIPDAEKFNKNIESELDQIKKIAEADEFSAKLKLAEKVIDEKTFSERVYQIRLKALLDKKKLYELEPDMARKVQDEITQLERDYLLERAKMETAAAKEQKKTFEEQVNNLRDVALSYTDLISKVLALTKVEQKRNEQLDEALDKQLEKLNKATQAKLKFAKTEADRDKINEESERQQMRLMDANEKKQKEAAAAGTQYTAQQKVEATIKAAAAMVQAIANIIANAATLGPFGIIAAPASIAAAVAMFEAAKANFGFKEGGFTGYGSDNQPAGIVHKNEFVLRSGSFAVGPDGNLVAVAGMGGGSAHVVDAIERQTNYLGEQLGKSTIINQRRMVLENKASERSRSRERV